MFIFGTVTDWLYRWWAYVTHGRTFPIVLGVAFALLALALLAASRTRWGQSKPLTKCIVLSVLAHVWLLMYAYGVRIILPQGDPRGYQSPSVVSIDASLLEPSFPEAATEGSAQSQDSPNAWEEPLKLAELPPAEVPGTDLPQIDARKILESVTANRPPPLLNASPMPALAADLFASETQPPAASSPALTQAPPLEEQLNAPEKTAVQVAQPANGSNQAPSAKASVPEEYRLRQASNRLQLARPFGADADSEAAVHAGLQWLAAAQSEDGSWDAKRFGAGTETQALGLHRYGTGSRADTGVSGLALLAFLSAGHTHQEGEHRETVRDGIAFLMRAQMPSGDLSGPKQIGQDPSVLNAKMYCHGIATLALAEAYAMTHDRQLEAALRLAAQFTLKAQDPRGGGWRYQPHEEGDLSQFGWQAMALRSMERSGILVPNEVKLRMHRFLDSCAAGPQRGLARYRPAEGAPSETMTAEAMACRLMIGYPHAAAAEKEAKAYILAHLPGTKPDNVYFWYYATLALFQLQDQDWQTWNQALKKRLLESQLPAYEVEAGSWAPDGLWGGYGGRVYATAMSCLCLEVYYRYLPMYHAPGSALHSTGTAEAPRDRLQR